MTYSADILLVSWRNEDLLLQTLESIKRNSKTDVSVSVFLNESASYDIPKIRSSYNINILIESLINLGLCRGLNTLAGYTLSENIILMDDDMYCFPGWDKELYKFREDNDLGDYSWVSSFNIEPKHSDRNDVIHANMGMTAAEFDEEAALAQWEQIKPIAIEKRHPISTNGGSPLLVSRAMYEAAGGYDSSFFPARGAELGFAKRCWDVGCRNFVSTPTSIVYHFSSVSMAKGEEVEGAISPQDRDIIFKDKYDITRKEFIRDCILKNHRWIKR